MMCPHGFAASPKGPKQKAAALVSPFHRQAFGCGHTPQAVMNTGARHWMTTDRAFCGSGLENAPATISGTTKSAPFWGKGTEYAGRKASPSSGASETPEGSYPKAERAKLWRNDVNTAHRGEDPSQPFQITPKTRAQPFWTWPEWLRVANTGGKIWARNRDASDGTDPLMIKTSDGEQTVEIGDWVVMGDDGLVKVVAV